MIEGLIAKSFPPNDKFYKMLPFLYFTTFHTGEILIVVTWAWKRHCLSTPCVDHMWVRKIT